MQAGFQFFESNFHGPTTCVVTEDRTGARTREIGYQEFDVTRRVIIPPFRDYQSNITQSLQLDFFPYGPIITPPSVRFVRSYTMKITFIRMTRDVAQVAAIRRFPGSR